MNDEQTTIDSQKKEVSPNAPSAALKVIKTTNRKKKANEFILENAEMIFFMRYKEDAIVTYTKIANELNTQKFKTSSDKGRWGPSTVEKICKKFMRSKKITEKNLPDFLAEKYNTEPKI